MRYPDRQGGARGARHRGCGADEEIPSIHGSTVYIYRQDQYEAVCRYVQDEQGPDLLSLEEIEARYGQ